MRTLAFQQGAGRGADYLILLHTSAAPDVAEWKAYVDQVGRTMSTARGVLSVFVATDGGGPNAAQRKLLTETFSRGPGDALTHVFTTSAFVRGIVTTFRWVARAPAVAHVPRDFSAVCAACALDPAAVLSDLLAVQKRFASVRIVEQIEHYYRHPKRSLGAGHDQGPSSK
ncbi:MAG TPA: hypothetical protein VFX59_25330 [Polyangiales bacterium]|nr:hypothetical protein [Polyangiales bacterium]